MTTKPLVAALLAAVPQPLCVSETGVAQSGVETQQTNSDGDDAIRQRGTAGGVDWELFEAPDGHRFLLVDTRSGAPLVHWACATPAGAGEDPRGMSGLALACVRASFEGIGTPTTDDETTPTDGGVPWRTRLATIPADGPRLSETGDGSIVAFTTPPASVGQLARLLEERRLGARLERVGRTLADVRREARQRTEDPLALLREELAGLGFFGTDRPYATAMAVADENDVPTRDVVSRTWAKTQRPGRGLDVLVGPVPTAAWRAVLQAEYSRTPKPGGRGDVVAPPRPGRRRASVPWQRIGRDVEAAVAIGLPWPNKALDGIDPASASAWLTEWLSGPDGAVARQMRRSDPSLAGVRIAIQEPFPDNRRPSLLLVEVWVARADPETPRRLRSDTLERALLDALDAVGRSGPSKDSFDGIRLRLRARHARITRNPDTLAIELARRCGLGGESPRAVLEPHEFADSSSLASLLREVLAVDDRITVLAEDAR